MAMMKRPAALVAAALLWAGAAEAQNANCQSYLVYGNVLTNAQWQYCLSLKQDAYPFSGIPLSNALPAGQVFVGNAALVLGASVSTALAQVAPQPQPQDDLGSYRLQELMNQRNQAENQSAELAARYDKAATQLSALQAESNAKDAYWKAWVEGDVGKAQPMVRPQPETKK